MSKAPRLRKALLACGCALLALVLLAGIAALFYVRSDWGVFRADNPFSGQNSPGGELSFVRDGVTYRYDKHIHNILLLGTDNGNGDPADHMAGQADTIFLLSVNAKTDEMRLLKIPRDVQVPVRHYNMLGDYLWARPGAICTAYGYGDGGVASGQMMMAAVSEFLYGIPVERFVSVDVSSIPYLVDLLGGTVPVYEYAEFAQVWPLPQDGGPLLLNRETAEVYLRARSLPGMDGSDAGRAVRQKEFLRSAAAIVRENMQSDFSYWKQLYGWAGYNVTTDLHTRELAFLAVRANKLQSVPIDEIEGELAPGAAEEFEFKPDETALREAVRAYYFKPVSCAGRHAFFA